MWGPGFTLAGMNSRPPPPNSRLCVGLLSGTSVDAVEAVLCRVEGTGPEVRISLLAHVSRPFTPEFTRRVLAANDARSLCELNFALGEHFAQAALEVIARAGLRPEDVDVIGSHGQTVAHLPGEPVRRRPPPCSSGEPSVIAERTGLPVVSDFRTRDVAAGGEGAPLVPYLDWALFRKPGVARALQNFGGIGNVSVVSDRLEDTIAFDTGPGNMVMDGLARRVTGGRLQCDLDGSLSRQGRVIPELLEELLAHPFLALPPPRSAGREGFGDALVERLWERHGATRPYDLDGHGGGLHRGGHRPGLRAVAAAALRPGGGVRLRGRHPEPGADGAPDGEARSPARPPPGRAGPARGGQGGRVLRPPGERAPLGDPRECAVGNWREEASRSR